MVIHFPLSQSDIESLLSINNLLINISDLKNLGKITQLQPAADNPEIAIHRPVVSVFNWDAAYIKACMDSLREYQIDDNIIARTDEFHNTDCYNELMACSASTGAFRINVGGYMIDIPKSAIPTLKSDHVVATVYNAPGKDFNVLRFKITKRNGIIVNQSMLFLPY